MTDELITWLRTQIDDDERMAKLLQDKRPGPWVADYDYAGPLDGVGVNAANGELVLVGRGYVPAEFAAEWHPARVLAEVEAKRRILDLIVPGRYEGGYGEAYLDVVRELAQPYAGRPGWREEWQLSAPA